MINTTALVVLCALSLLMNLFLALYIMRLAHWLEYWKKAFRDAISPISPVKSVDPYAELYDGEVSDGSDV